MKKIALIILSSMLGAYAFAGITSGSGGGTATSVDMSVPSFLTISGNPITTSGTLAVDLATQTTNKVFAAPNGTTGTPTFRALVSADIPTLNQSTSGNAATATALAADPADCASNTYATSINASGTLTCGTVTNAGLAGSIAASKFVGSDIATVGTITAGVWNATTIAIANGGTGATSKAAAFDALSPMSASGDILYGGASGTGTRLAKGSDTQVLTLASGVPTWATPAAAGGSPNEAVTLNNCSIAASIAANALTVALKDAAGADPSSGSPCLISVRNATITTGTFTQISVQAATSVVVPDTVSLGCTAAVACDIYVYAINNAGTIELGLIFSDNIDEGAVQTSTAIAAQNTAAILSSTTARTSKAVRMIGRVQVTPAASFHWSNAVTSVSSGVPTYPIVTDWYPCTVTGVWATNTTYPNTFCKREGDSLNIRGKVALTGAPTGTLAITLPNSLTMDTSKMYPWTNGVSTFPGTCRAVDASTNNYQCSIMGGVSATVFTFSPATVTGSNVIQNSQINATTPFTWGNGDWIEYSVERMPIVGWGRYGP